VTCRPAAGSTRELKLEVVKLIKERGVSARNLRTTCTWSRSALSCYNFVKMHKAVRMTPAMAAGVTEKFWSMTELAEMIDATRPMLASRGGCAACEKDMRSGRCHY
jgi:hypothetical protein